MWETWVWSLGREVSWRRKWQTTPVFLPRKSHGQRSLVSMGSQRVRHDWATSLFFTSLVAQTVKRLPTMRETRLRSLGWEDPLEKEMATPLQYSCLENPMDRGAWWAAVHGVTKSQTRLSEYSTLTDIILNSHMTFTSFLNTPFLHSNLQDWLPFHPKSSVD